MAEARPEQEDPAGREQVVRRPPGGTAGRPDRRKPEHRHSQGPLSSIRAVIKRTATRSTSLAEPSRDRDRDRDRERDRDRDRERARRRPEITILSAEPLSSAPWFPGASAGFPPPPPPAAQIWGPTIPPSVQPPPSYEEVIREKTQEQVLLPPPSSSSSLITISTQTDTGSGPHPEDSPACRGPVRPPRPPLCRPPRPPPLDDIALAASRSSPDLLAEPCPPSTSGAPTDQRDHPPGAPTPPTTPDPPERPRPRPRTRLAARPVASDVRVQTLVKLREDGAATLAALAGAAADQEAGRGKYLQELLEAFSTDDWGFPDCRGDSSGDSQSEGEEEEEEEEDMATLRARILAFEQQQQGAEGGEEGGDVAKRPEPRPRPRLQGQPAKSVPPTVAPKPKSLPQTPKPSSKVFWEDAGLPESSLTEAQAAPPPTAAPPPPCGNAEKPSVPPKPTEPSAPVAAPRPPPLKSASSTGEPANPKPPPRPPVAPRVGTEAPPREPAPPTLPARPSVEAGTGDQTETRDADKQTVKVGSVRPGVPTKPAALTSPRRASAPNLAPKPAAAAAAPLAPPPAPALRKGPKPESATASPNPPDPPLPPRPSSTKLLPLRPPPIKSTPGRPPPPTVSSAHSANQTAPPPPGKTGPAPSVPSASQCSPSPTPTSRSPVSANQMQPQPASKKGPPLPPRPKPGHALYSYVKQEVLIVLDDPPPSEHPAEEGGSRTAVDPPQCLLDVDTQPEAPLDRDGQSKPSLEGLGLSESQSILPVEPKERPDPPPVSGPRCVALFDYEGEEEDELTFSQGDVVRLLQLIGAEWGRGQIHGRVGVFPLNFVEVVQPPGGEPAATRGAVTGPTGAETPPDPPPEWAEALYDFPAQTADDLSFHKGALIQVTEHLDPQWRRGRLEGREGIYPAAFTQRCQAQPITGQQTAVKGVAKFDFTAEGEDELTLKVGDVITQVEFVDEQWILGVVDKRRGIVPKNYISLLR